MDSVPTALRASLLDFWRRVPRWGKVCYGAGWLLTSLLYSVISLAAWIPIEQVDRVVLLPLLMGAIWPVTLPWLVVSLLLGPNWPSYILYLLGMLLFG